MEKLYNLGVDGIITDYPNKLIDLLEGVRWIGFGVQHINGVSSLGLCERNAW
jgi:hypothetical protein